MKFSTQLDDLKALNEALASDCDKVRFGPEFCEWKIPPLDLLEKAFRLIEGKGKEFAYVTPRVSNKNLENLREHLAYLNDQGEVNVIVNDLGVLGQVEQFSNLKPCLGRQLITALGRCPWKQITEFEVESTERRDVAKTFYQTDLNYGLTIQSFKEHGVQGADVDWIPQSFPYYDFLVENGLDLSVHLYLVPVTITRRCHMARFLGEERLENCSRPCYTKAFRLRQEIMNLDLFLNGNAVFRLTEPSQKDINKLYESKVAEFVISMNSITKIESQREINRLIQRLVPKSTFQFPRLSKK